MIQPRILTVCILTVLPAMALAQRGAQLLLSSSADTSKSLHHERVKKAVRPHGATADFTAPASHLESKSKVRGLSAAAARPNQSNAAPSAIAHKLGLLPSSTRPDIYRGAKIGALPRITDRATLPSSFDNSAGLPPVGDQGIQNSCVAWTLAYYYKTYQERQEFGWDVNTPDHQFSPSFLYSQYAPFDEGSTFDEAFNLLLDQGAASLTAWPYNEADYTTWPSYDAFRTAIPQRIQSYTRLGDGLTPGMVDAMKARLAGGDLVAIGIPIYRPAFDLAGRFDLLDSSNYHYDMPADGDVVLAGNHSLAVVGYDDSAFGGKGGFKVVNQWGSAWGKNGFAYLSYQFVQALAFDIYVMEDRLNYQPTGVAHFKLAHPFWAWNYDNVTVTIGTGPEASPLWSKVVLTGLERSSLTVDMAVDVTEGAAQLPPTASRRWWIKVSDSATEDTSTLSIFDITYNNSTQTAGVVMPLTGPFFSGSFYAYVPAGTAAANTYYVNDGSLTGDQYCSAVGNDANNGLSSATPKATVQAVVDGYVLKAGDRVLIDSGSYTLSADINLNQLDGGSIDNPVRFIGATAANGEPLAVFNRGSSGGQSFQLYGGARFIQLERLWLKGGASGVRFDGSWGYGSDALTLRGVRMSNTSSHAVDLFEAQEVVLQNCDLSTFGTSNGHSGIFIIRSTAAVDQCTIIAGAGKRGAALGSGSSYYASGANLSLRNSIVTANGSGSTCISLGSYAQVSAASYNNLYATGGATIGFTPDSTNLTNDPLFADAANGDFHLKSSAGRWNPSANGGAGGFVIDTVNSPCIDAGDPDVAVENEPAPNGGRVNIGAYGGTQWESKSPAVRFVRVLSPNGGETWKGIHDVTWRVSGTGWISGDTVKLEYWDGAAWQLLAAGSANVPYNRGTYSWNVSASGITPGSNFSVRVTANADSAVFDESDGAFTVQGGAVRYYVNDASVANDEYCTAAGSDTNDGLSAATPKANLQAILDAYDLEPGDTVYVDTGNYLLSANVVIAAQDGGSVAGHVRFLGSPKGSTLNRQSTATGARCLEVHGDYSWIEGFTCTGANTGLSINVDTARNAVITHNILHGNSALGLGVTSYSYGAGSHYLITSNLLYNNGMGMNLVGGNYGGTGIFDVANNTIVVNGIGISCNSAVGGSHLSNNVIWSSGAGNYCLYDVWDTIGACDYNDLIATGGAIIAQRIEAGYSKNYATLLDWQNRTSHDTHSLSVDPLFADLSAGDYHLKSTGGRWNPATSSFVADTTDSPAIDAGNPTDLAGNEISPNGGRINMGVYGGTAEASKSPVGRVLTVLSPNGAEVWRGTKDILWLTTGQGWTTGDTIKLQYSSDGGSTWNSIAGASSLSYSTGKFSWNTTTVPSGVKYRVRAICNQNPAVQDTSDANFTIHNTGLSYYVNDSYDPTVDQYCTAAGSDTNDGLSAATPKASLQAILDAYDLEAGDTVYVDTGTYVLSSNVLVNGNDNGAAGAFVTIQGSTHPSGTVLNRGSTASGAACIKLDDVDFIRLRHLRLTGAQDGLYISCHNRTYEILHCALYGNSRYGVHSPDDHANWDNLTLRFNGCRIYGNTAGGIVITTRSNNSTAEGCTLYGNGGTALNGLRTARRNIVFASGNGATCVSARNDGYFGDWNDLFTTAGAQVSSSGPGLSTFQVATGQETHSLSVDPVFVDAANGDFHLRSTGGRWDSATGSWVVDAVDSPCIDAGDPAEAVGAEVPPNGGRINMGSYGGTVEASKSPVGRVLTVLSPNGAEVWRGVRTIRWFRTGQAWQSSDTLTLRYSVNSGSTWTTINGSAGALASRGEFEWNLSGLAPGSQYRVQAVCDQIPAVSDMSDADFTVQAGGVYYVNDSYDETVDQYCTAAGNDANDGFTPATPKASVQAILSTYDLEPGDTIFVDAGTYNLGSNIVVDTTDGGSVSNRVRIIGVKGKTILDRGAPAVSGSTCIQVNADYVTIENFNCRNGYYGIYVASGSDNCQVLNNSISNGGYHGIFVNEAQNTLLEHNLIRHSGSAGAIRLRAYYYEGYYALACTVKNNTVVTDGSNGMDIDANGGPILRNNIISTSGSGKFGLDLYDGRAISTSNYNNFLAINGAKVGKIYQVQAATLSEWRADTGCDINSLSVDPLFADPPGGDYHLKSASGRYNPSSGRQPTDPTAWVTDSLTSLAIDAGSPADAVAEEAAPNGGRINLGAYGGTVEASRSSSAPRVVSILAPNNGETWRGVQAIELRVAGAGWQAGDTLRLESSGDAGVSWQAISGGSSVAYNQSRFWWDTRSVANGTNYLVRAVCVQSPTVQDRSDNLFTIANGGTLSLTVNPVTFSEAAGVTAATATVTRNGVATETALIVNLFSSDVSEATVPASVTIAVGAASATFSVRAVDDTLVDGPIAATVKATSSGLTSGTAIVTVTDNERGSVRGRIANSSGVGLVGVQLTRSGGGSAVTNNNGDYVFSNLAYGACSVAPVVTPSMAGITMTPASRSLTVNGNLTNINFTASFTIGGRITNSAGTGIANILVKRITGSSVATAYTDANGNYKFNRVPSGSYTLTPVMNGLTFTPGARAVTVSTVSIVNQNFFAAFSISGRITNSAGVGIGNVLVKRATGNSIAAAYTDANGYYRFIKVPNGSYTLTPEVNGITFTPGARSVTVATVNIINQNFIATFTISGRITNSAGAGIANILVKRAGANSLAAVYTDANGYYTFIKVPNGSYTLTPQATGVTFTPASRAVTVATVNIANQNFFAAFSISGRVTNSDGVGVANVPVKRIGNNSLAAAYTDANGYYTLLKVPSGSYTLLPEVNGVSFTPASRAVTITAAGAVNQNFIATFSISGRITNSVGVGLANVLVKRITDNSIAAAYTDASGNYKFSGVRSGSYTLTPEMTGVTFTPASRAVTVGTANVANQNFIGSG